MVCHKNGEHLIAANPAVHPSTQTDGFDMEHLSRVPGDDERDKKDMTFHQRRDSFRGNLCSSLFLWLC